MLRTLIRFAAIGAFLLFLATSFRAGWTESTTDFPNYYTAASLLRRGERLQQFYDWTWFQRQMSFVGFDRQLGAYTPQTPLTMLPIVPIAQASPQTAKRLWLAANLGFLVAVLLILAAMAGTPVEQVALLVFCGHGSLASNFSLGQYYVFLLFLITLAVYSFRARQTVIAGFILGIAFGLKLYSGPIILYFLVRRKWNAAGAMAASALLMLLLATALFGWADVWIYLVQVLPRSLDGGSIDPYNPGNPTLVTLLRRLLISEPQLNPRPLMNAPWLFFGLRTVIQVCLMASVVLGSIFTREREADDGLLAWFLVLLVLISVNTSGYTFVLLLIPIALLWPRVSTRKRLLLAACYILLNVPIEPAWLFPKLWLLFLLYFLAGLPYLLAIPRRWAFCVIGLALIWARFDATKRIRLSLQEPAHRYARIGSESHMIFSSFPTVSKFGLFYQCMGSLAAPVKERYLLCWTHDGLTETLAFPGHAFRPQANASDGSISLELVQGKSDTMVRFDPATRGLTPDTSPPATYKREDVVSPDRHWVAFERGPAGSRELWVRSVATGAAHSLASGRCDNGNPTWELDSSAIIFASDCERGIGLPALYRVPAISWQVAHN